MKLVEKKDDFSESAGDEQAIWEMFKQGDRTAYEYLYSEYASFLFRYGCKVVADRELVKDSIHDLYTELWKNKANLGEPQSVKNYLLKAVRNKLIREMNRQSKYAGEEVLHEDEHGYTVSHEFELISEESRNADEKRLVRALKKLSNKQKEIIFLLYYNNLSPAEVAAIMSVSVRTIYNTTFNAIQSLKTEMVVSLLIILIKQYRD